MTGSLSRSGKLVEVNAIIGFRVITHSLRKRESPSRNWRGAGKYRRLTLTSAAVFERNVSDLGKEGKKEGARRHFYASEQHAARGRTCGAVRYDAARHGLTVRATDHNRGLTYGYFPRGSFDSSRSVAFAMSYTYAYYDSRYNQFGSWRGLPSARRASSRSIVTERTWLRW